MYKQLLENAPGCAMSSITRATERAFHARCLDHAALGFMLSSAHRTMTPIVPSVSRESMSKEIQAIKEYAYHAIAIHAKQDPTGQNVDNIWTQFALSVPLDHLMQYSQVLEFHSMQTIVVGAALLATKSMATDACPAFKELIQAMVWCVWSVALVSTQLLFWQQAAVHVRAASQENICMYRALHLRVIVAIVELELIRIQLVKQIVLLAQSTHMERCLLQAQKCTAYLVPQARTQGAKSGKHFCLPVSALHTTTGSM